MWSFERSRVPALLVAGAIALSACTVEPLRGARTTVGSSTVSQSLQAVEVAPVNTRVAQQVRNELIFALRGGSDAPPARYRVGLDVTSTSSDLSIRSSSLAPTSARVIMTASYTAREIATNRIVAQGLRRTFAAYDRTTQSFANERAQRDAENRAARVIAEQIRLGLAQQLAGS